MCRKAPSTALGAEGRSYFLDTASAGGQGSEVTFKGKEPNGTGGWTMQKPQSLSEGGPGRKTTAHG